MVIKLKNTFQRCLNCYKYIVIVYLTILIGITMQYENDGNQFILVQRLIVSTGVFLLIVFEIYLISYLDKVNESLLDSFVKYRYLCAIISLIALSILKIHGFAMDEWSKTIVSNNNLTSLLWGSGKEITSDAWGIFIPQIISQVKNGFPLYNMKQMTIGENALLQGLPVGGIYFIGQPHYWGLLLGIDFGLSWLFWFKKIALFMTVFEVFNYLTKQKHKIALVGALVLTMAPLTDWWFSHSIILVVIYAHWCIGAVIMYLQYWNEWKYKIIAAFLGLIGFVAYVFCWYPALQVPFGILAIIVIVYILMQFLKNHRFYKEDYILLLTVVIVAIGIIVLFLSQSRESIELLQSTAYPGHKINTGGEYGGMRLIYYFLQVLLPYVSGAPFNQCEVSSIIPFLPIIILLVPCLIYKKNNKTFFLILYIYFIFALSWMFVSYPALIAKITLFSYVSSARAVWIVGYLSVYLSVLYMAYTAEHKGLNKWLSLLITGISGLCSCLIVYKLGNNVFGMYFSINGKITLIVTLIVFLLFWYCLCRGKLKIVLTLLILVSIYFEISITPIERGTVSFYANNLSGKIAQLNEEDSNWVIDEAPFWIGNYVLAHGGTVMNCTNMYMDYNKWKIMDPSGENVDKYNRYAQENVTLTSKDTKITLPERDQVNVALNVNSLREFATDYVLTTRKIDHLSNENVEFELYYQDKDSGYNIYSVSYHES